MRRLLLAAGLFGSLLATPSLAAGKFILDQDFTGPKERSRIDARHHGKPAHWT